MLPIDSLLKENDAKLNAELDLRFKKFHELLNVKMYNFFKFAETNDISYLEKELERIEGKSSSTLKENIEPDSTVVREKRTRKRRTSLNHTLSSAPTISVKQEKLSTSSVNSASSAVTASSSKNDSQWSTDQMPPPSRVPPGKKKIKQELSGASNNSTRSTRTKSKQLQTESEERKTSDVIIQNRTITMIDITDDKESDNDEKKSKKSCIGASNGEQVPTRTTRTKTRLQKKLETKEITEQTLQEQLIVVDTPAEIPSKSLRSRSKEDNTRSKEDNKNQNDANLTKVVSPMEQDPNNSNQTEYQDAVSEIVEAGSENVNIQNTTTVINSTVLIENPTIAKIKNVPVEPEPKEKDWRTPLKTKSKKKQIKEIFSPYEKTSLKKKVEAFEKIGSASKECSTSKIPVLRDDMNNDRGSALKAKPFTPFTRHFMPKSCSTSSKTSTNNEGSHFGQTSSAMKASQLRDKDEAQLKKDALLQAQADENRRKREEKQLKAQQQRELMQKEKERQLKIQKLKEEKYKQAVAEKEEKLQKRREEAERKRLLAKNKAKVVKDGGDKEQSETDASELGKQERKAHAAKTQQDRSLPLYMYTKEPLLPTEDCYDSDDDGHKKRTRIPSWCSKDRVTKQLYAQLVSGEKTKNTLFSCTIHCPDLVDIFETIDPKKLKRTSSAQWKKPPRYTLFSMTSNIRFSEDSDIDMDV